MLHPHVVTMYIYLPTISYLFSKHNCAVSLRPDNKFLCIFAHSDDVSVSLWHGDYTRSQHVDGACWRFLDIFYAEVRYFCLLKRSLCQIRQFKSHKLLLCRGWETWQATCCSSVSHHLQFMTCMTSPARKRSPLTASTTDKPSWEIDKNQTR